MAILSRKSNRLIRINHYRSVIASLRSLGGYAYGLSIKKQIIALEKTKFAIDLDNFWQGR